MSGLSGALEHVDEGAIETEQVGELIVVRLQLGGKIAGSVKLAMRPLHEPALQEAFADTPTVYQLFVDEAMRGCGIAGKLMDRVEANAKEAGARQILLGVIANNDAARKIYERRGYEYVEVDGQQAVESVWETTDDEGIAKTEVVNVMPMKKELS